MEGKGTGGRIDLRLSSLRQNTRQAATRENRVASVGAAWVITPGALAAGHFCAAQWRGYRMARFQEFGACRGSAAMDRHEYWGMPAGLKVAGPSAD